MYKHNIGNLCIEISESTSPEKIKSTIVSCARALYGVGIDNEFLDYLETGKASTQVRRDAFERKLREVTFSLVFKLCLEEGIVYEQAISRVLGDSTRNTDVGWLLYLPLSTRCRRNLHRAASPHQAGNMKEGLPHLVQLWREGSLGNLTYYDGIGELSVQEIGSMLDRYLAL